MGDWNWLARGRFSHESGRSPGQEMLRLTVSVLVPCFNAGRWLIECIESVKKQSFPTLEIIIVDDGSDETETLEILGGYKDSSSVSVLRKANGGVSSARNAALDVAKGDYVLFLDADDYLEPNALEALVAAAEKTGAVFVGGGWRDVDEAGRPLRSIAPKAHSADYFSAVVAIGNAVGSVLQKCRAGLKFNDTMPWEALEYFLDCLSNGEKAVFINDVVVNKRQSLRPDRLTIKLDHFEPLRMGTFFVGRKKKLLALGTASDERFAALDKRILACIHGLLYANRYADGAILAKSVNRDLLGQVATCRFGSFAWFFKWGGVRAAYAFVAINRVIDMLSRGD